MFPAHETYQVLIDIWSRGCNPQLRHALPVLLVWEVVVSVISAVGVFKRIRGAVAGEEEGKKSFDERVEAAMRLREKAESEEMVEGAGHTLGSGEFGAAAV